jgi:hypothetical protein
VSYNLAVFKNKMYLFAIKKNETLKSEELYIYLGNLVVLSGVLGVNAIM